MTATRTTTADQTYRITIFLLFWFRLKQFQFIMFMC